MEMGKVLGLPLYSVHTPICPKVRSRTERQRQHTAQDRQRSQTRDGDIALQPLGHTSLAQKPQVCSRTNPPGTPGGPGREARETWVHGAGSLCQGMSPMPHFRTPEPSPLWTVTWEGAPGALDPHVSLSHLRPYYSRREGGCRGGTFSLSLCSQEGGVGV